MYQKSLPFKIITILLLIISVGAKAQITPHEAISQMTKGINLGNTLEPPLEGEWGNPATQEYMFDMYKKEGFQCIRIPVRWDKHMGTTSPFKINETWFNRVEQILDWGLSKGLFVVVNSHHDGWIKSNYDNALNQARFDSLWSQVAARFKNKSEKLIFEICNEPEPPMTKVQSDKMHQSALIQIRKTNPTRLVIFQGIGWGGSEGLIDAAIPNDPYLIGSFHSYDPYLFGLEGQGTWGSSSDISTLRTKFQKVKDWSVKNNIPVFLGEFGAINKADYNSRMRHYKTYVELAHSFGFASCAWDDGGQFRIMNRSAKTWIDDIKDILVHSSELSPKGTRLVIVQDTIIRLSWVNSSAVYDSITIERRTSTTTFKPIISLRGDTTAFSEYKLPRNTEYYYRVVAHLPNEEVLYSYPQKILLPTYIPKVPVPREYYTGNPIPVPGRVEAEHFDKGEDGLTYHDSDTRNSTQDYRPNEPIDIYDLGNGAYYVIDNYPGEWLEYTVNVAEKGSYDINAFIAGYPGGGTFQVKIGAVESEILKSPNTLSWSKTKAVNFTMNLEAGIQIMRLRFIEKPLFYIDYLDFTKKIETGSSLIDNDHFHILQNKEGLVINLAGNQQTGILKIYNILGAEVKQVKYSGSSVSIPIQNMRPGVYVLHLSSGNQNTSRKIIIP